jgi:hypothetical protein
MSNEPAKAPALCAFLLSLTCICARAQEPGTLVVAGPFGRPVAVADEIGHMSIPISIYSDSDLEIFVPDITSPGWIYWFAGGFRQTGVYEVYLYTYFKNNHWCMENVARATGRPKDPAVIEACSALRYRRRRIKVDTRKKTVQILQDYSMERDGALRLRENNWASREPQSLKDIAGSPFGKEIDRITAIIQKEATP